MSWTEARIEALAPDPASLKAGKGLAGARKWIGPGRNETALWGECPGSGAQPYRTQIDLREPAFRCSCPSRKFPCKHALGLFLLYACEPAHFEPTEPPTWVGEWLEARNARARKAEAQADAKPQNPDQPARREPDSKTDDKRRANVSAGLQELSLWLEDLLRRGLAELPGESYKFFDQMAARLVDAQAPGLARWIRELAALPAQGGSWAEQVLERLGLIQLLLSGYARLDQLAPELQAEIRTQLGWTISQESLLEAPGTHDQWLVLGQVLGFEERLRIRRTWLLGRQSRRYALLLDFAFGNQPFKQVWAPGSSITAEVVWFPSSWPLRALVKPGHALGRSDTLPESFANWQGLRRFRAEALASNPWLELLPACLGQLVPHLQIDRLWLRDAEGYSL
ncbi:MAG: SWIM zinc finger domain-containing protein, partial [Candidatus Sericytochromatia bacterium]